MSVLADAAEAAAPLIADSLEEEAAYLFGGQGSAESGGVGEIGGVRSAFDKIFGQKAKVTATGAATAATQAAVETVRRNKKRDRDGTKKKLNTTNLVEVDEDNEDDIAKSLASKASKQPPKSRAQLIGDYNLAPTVSKSQVVVYRHKYKPKTIIAYAEPKYTAYDDQKRLYEARLLAEAEATHDSIDREADFFENHLFQHVGSGNISDKVAKYMRSKR